MSRTLLRTAPVLLLALAAACGRGGRDDAVAEAVADTTTSPYGAATAENLRVVPAEIEIPGLPAGWEGMRVAALSDFHLGLWPDNERVARAAVARAAAERPDAVVLLGDYVARGNDYDALRRVLAPLRGIPTFAVLGNEDMAENPEGADSARILTTRALQAAGAQVLVGTRAPFARGGDTAYIGGVEPFVARRPDWRRAEQWNAIPGGASTPLLLAHMPVTGLTLPTDRYSALLAGHTFCGRVEVPGTPRLTWFNTEVLPQEERDPATTRIYRVRGATLFVTCGVGFGFVPIRYGAPPEVAMVTLRSPGGAAASDSADVPDGVVNVDSLIQQFTPDTAGTDTSGG